ncbi:MAG: LysM peptidoglycan-binding protein [Solirubrobacterales bacterium]|nr:LysM peptidoglycan-binding protein [Solirubrobacterales bacterium]
MTHHSPARWLAPIALVTCAFAVYTVVSAGSAGGGSGAAGVTTQSSSGTSAGTKRPKSTTRKPKAPRTYTVLPGDTLSAIAAKTGVALARIQALNPQADTQSLQAGQKIKLGP